MSVLSMTGYGDADGQIDGWALKVSVRAVNHKALDVRVNSPRDWAWFEPHVAKILRAKVNRGRVDVLIEVRQAASADGALWQVDEDALGSICAQLQSLGQRHGITQPLSWSEVLNFRRLFEKSDAQAADPEQQLEQCAALVGMAVDRFNASRAEEGATIASTMLGYLDFLGDGVAQVAAIRPQLLEGYRQRLKERLDEVLQRDDIALDEQRLAQEVVLFADRTDVAEEIQRAGAHVERLKQLFGQPQAEPVGKKVDFYLQELIRETNTMASKSNFSDLTELVVQMKSVIEQMREQAANIE